MKKTIITLALLFSVAVTHAGVKTIGEVNGVKIVRIKTAGLFAPSSTTIVSYNPNCPGVIEVLSSTGGPGVVPAVANAGGLCGAAALLRPARTNVKNEGGNAAGGSSASTATGNGGAGGSSTATGGNGNGGSATGGSFVPPGHINNPSGNH